MAHGSVLLAGAFLLAALTVRGLVAGRAPWSNLHETAVTFAFGVTAVYAVLERRLAIRSLAAGVALLGAGLVGLALAQRDEVRPLVPALQAPLLLTVHVGAAMLAYAVGAVALAGAVAELLPAAGRRQACGAPFRRGLPGGSLSCRAARLPGSDRRHRARGSVGQPGLALLLEQRPEGAGGGGNLAGVRRLPARRRGATGGAGSPRGC